MLLLIDGVSLRIAQMGPEFIVVDADRAHASGQASVRMRVDDSEREWDVYLPQGIAAGGSQEVTVTLPPGQTMRQDRAVKAVAGK